MKKFIALLAMVFMLALSAPVMAQDLDMGNLTCVQLNAAAEDPDTLTMIYFWLDGYMSHATGQTVLKQSEVEANVTGLLNACAADPNVKVLDLLAQ